MFSSDKWFGAEAGFYNSVATQSLRFDATRATTLYRDIAQAGNRKIATYAFWLKFDASDTSFTVFSKGDGGGTQTSFDISIDSSRLRARFFESDSQTGLIRTNRLFRDSSAWYHIVVAIDVSQGTSSDRVKLYINGTQETSLESSSYPSDSNTVIGNNSAHTRERIGDSQMSYLPNTATGGSSSNRLNGYLCDFHHVDGQQLTPSSFGEFKNGVWIAKDYTGNHGDNGFRLEFKQTGDGQSTASSSTIGADTGVDGSGSATSNHFKDQNFETYDSNMPDSPENNFPTWNSIAPHSTYGISTFSEGNLKSQNTPNNNKYCEITFHLDETNKYYFEYYNITTTGALQPASLELLDLQASSSNKVGFYITTAGYITLDGSTIGTGFPTLSAGDIVNIAYDGATGKIWFGKNGTYYNESGSATGNPADGTNPIATVTPTTFKITSVFYQQGAIMNFGQDSSFAGNKTSGSENAQDSNGIGDFYDTVPSGFLALCSANLPEPTISPNADTQADDHFNTKTYSGNSSTQAITGIGFQPDWVWTKIRSSANNHYLLDSSRGGFNRLNSNNTNQEATSSNAISSFDSDGYTIEGAQNEMNLSGQTYVSWNWKANGGTTSSNTDGSITSTVQANTTAGFSIVLYTGTRSSDGGETGTPTTIGHGLGTKPSMVITKARDSTTYGNWNVWHPGYQPDQTYLNYQLWLNLTSASNNAGWQRTDTGFTTTTFCPARYAWDDVSGIDYVAYCFAEVESYSRFGSYTGNGSTDGTFVYTGFRPSWVMVKRTDGVVSWNVADSTRSPHNLVDEQVQPNLSNAENLFFDYDFLSNGFKIRTSDSSKNASGGTYIYMAFAENPFKYANAR
tara:strand:+ start:2213 stop:4768 length:2556 start_codon:yes stop_codon:yes gene_type:complete